MKKAVTGIAVLAITIAAAAWAANHLIATGVERAAEDEWREAEQATSAEVKQAAAAEQAAATMRAEDAYQAGRRAAEHAGVALWAAIVFERDGKIKSAAAERDRAGELSAAAASEFKYAAAEFKLAGNAKRAAEAERARAASVTHALEHGAGTHDIATAVERAQAAADIAADHARNANDNKRDAYESVESSELRSLAMPFAIEQAGFHAERAGVYSKVVADMAEITERAAKAAQAATNSGDDMAAETCAEAAESLAKSAREQARLASISREIAHGYMTEYLYNVEGIYHEAEQHGRQANEYFSGGKRQLEQCLDIRAADHAPDNTW